MDHEAYISSPRTRRTRPSTSRARPTSSMANFSEAAVHVTWGRVAGFMWVVGCVVGWLGSGGWGRVGGWGCLGPRALNSACSTTPGLDLSTQTVEIEQSTATASIMIIIIRSHLAQVVFLEDGEFYHARPNRFRPRCSVPLARSTFLASGLG